MHPIIRAGGPDCLGRVRLEVGGGWWRLEGLKEETAVEEEREEQDGRREFAGGRRFQLRRCREALINGG